MDWKLELMLLPVTDLDRAGDFYANYLGFNLDHDHVVSEETRFVQLTPPGSGCSIAFGKGLTDAEPGSVQGLFLVVDDSGPGAFSQERGRGRPGGRAALGPLSVLLRS